MNNRLLFVHIPKTAGTSFRKAAEEYFGNEKTIFDYGASSGITSSIVQTNVYKYHDMYRLDKELSTYKDVFFSGHFPAEKYAALFGTLNTITFVREPVEQVLSHYEHQCKYNNYNFDVKKFIRDDKYKNIQSKMLSGRPLELYGFIGITEEYEKSIELINDYYQIDLKLLNTNVNTTKKLNKFNINAELLNMIKTENQLDLQLYENAKKIFYKRLEYYNKKEVYTHQYIQLCKNRELRGVAFRKDSEMPIRVEIYKDDDFIETIEAKYYRPGLVRYNLPRKSFVGFNYKLKEQNLYCNNLKVQIEKGK